LGRNYTFEWKWFIYIRGGG